MIVPVNDPYWIVIDTSLALNVLLGSADNPALSVWAEWNNRNVVLHAPELLVFELSNVFRKQEHRKGLAPSEIDLAVNLLLKTPVHYHSALLDIERAIQITRQRGLAKTYDMFYVALAERIGAALGTSDETMRDTANALGVPVVFVNAVL